MLHEILKQATQKQHDNLEQLMFVNKIMSGTLSVDEYKQILITNYITHARLENQLLNSLTDDLKTKLQVNNRYKLSALEKDLKESGIDFMEINQDKTDTVISKNSAAVLGAMYVLEGATLGGNVIVKKLKVNQNLQNLHLNFYYYQVYGSELVTNWKQFCQILNTKVAAEDYETSIQSALKTFDYFVLAHESSNKNTTAEVTGKS
ncbi:MAG: hypothetical protein EOP42_08295 [Sphingobacteriaceae bacterium]|nr:MAG: hypothetical protein EOP42_08295 [Sphingobacteriaceae bacterium]